VADALLDGKAFGQVRTSKGVRKYEADADCLFRGWPMAVLVNEQTSGETEWLAAALQDRKRAVLVGAATAGQGLTFASIPTEDGGAVTLATGLLERADGSPLQTAGSYQRRPTMDRASAQNDRAGVKPDHEVVDPERNRRRVGPSTVTVTNEPPAGTAKKRVDSYYRIDPDSRPSKEQDPVIVKAVEILRSLLSERLKDQQARKE
jgi:carboxyl-terminal processing protease